MNTPTDTPHGPRLSALDGWIDICRTGTWQGMTGEFTVSKADFDAMVAGYATADPAPVVLGHPETNEPAQGWVDKIRRVGDRLQARLVRLEDSFRAACEAGRYGARSISVANGPDGWKFLHLGFLGAQRPAVDGLAPTNFAAGLPVGTELVFSAPLETALAATPLGGDEERSGWSTIEHMLRGLREWVIERSTIQTADRVLPAWGLNELKGLGEITPEAMTELSGRIAALCAPPLPALPETQPETLQQITTGEDTSMSGTPLNTPPAQPPAGDAANLAAGRAQLEADRQQLEADRLAFAAAQRAGDARAAVAAHVEARRILPAEAHGLTALLAGLDDTMKIMLASPDGISQQEVTPRALLDTFLSGLPARGPETRELAGARQTLGQTLTPTFAAPGTENNDDTTLPPGQTVDHVALAAQVLVASDPTGQTNIADAVRRIQTNAGGN